MDKETEETEASTKVAGRSEFALLADTDLMDAYRSDPTVYAVLRNQELTELEKLKAAVIMLSREKSELQKIITEMNMRETRPMFLQGS